jgi:TonB family protein
MILLNYLCDGLRCLGFESFDGSQRAAVQRSEKVKEMSLLNPASRERIFRGHGSRSSSLFCTGFLFLILVLILSNPAQAQDGRKAKVNPQPAYPELARKNNIQGITRLQIVISPDGSVKEVKVLGGSPVLAQAAVDAVKKWKYEAASSESTAVLKFEFRP